ncbi:MAG TPA: hypothetical protein PLP65_09200 [Bacteroidales bacterium]|nr:hypothetical protein [Bacteroidales bacterium]HOU99008.1 hypothetical protein [Bacteroidales bacterium]
MNKVIIISFICFVPLLWSNKCEKSKNETKSAKMNIQNSMVDKDYDFSAYQDKFTIKKAELKDSLLTLTIEANVCNDDKIDLVFNGNYLKSYPPKAQLGLRFQENSKCKKNTVIRTYNLNPVKYSGGKATIFLIKGSEPITYNY